MHHDDLVRELERLLLVVGDEQTRDAELAVQLVEPAAKVLAHLRVERTERLVEQQHLGLRRERPRERDPLALPARELVRVALGERRQLDEVEQLADPLFARLLRLLAHPQTERDVVGAPIMCRNSA